MRHRGRDLWGAQLVLCALTACTQASSDDEPRHCVVAVPDHPEYETPKRTSSTASFIYPPQAQRDGIEAGGVVLEFSVDVNGVPFDVEVAAACPPGVFEAAALRDFSSVRFETPSPSALENRHFNRLLYRLEDVMLPEDVVQACEARAEREQVPVACDY